MSALGQKRTFLCVRVMSALLPKAEIRNQPTGGLLPEWNVPRYWSVKIREKSIHVVERELPTDVRHDFL